MTQQTPRPGGAAARFPPWEFDDRMNLARLTELESLFGRRYQALALLCLHQEGPMRWADIARAMHRRAGEHIHDKEITRSLKALEAVGLAQGRILDNGCRVRELTPAGVCRAERIAEIIGPLM